MARLGPSVFRRRNAKLATKGAKPRRLHRKRLMLNSFSISLLEALSSSVLSALKDRLLGLLVAGVMTTLAAFLLLPRLSTSWLVLGAILVYWLWRLNRRGMAGLATRAFAGGQYRRARRLYWFLLVTTLERVARQSCRLSLAACDASNGDYERAVGRLSKETTLEGTLQAVALNLEAYCLARLEARLEEALQMSDQATRMQPQVPGFRHTRGVVLIALNRLEEATRELEATWSTGESSSLLEAERCFDLGRLWAARGHGEYAHDYFDRSFRASPESTWAQKAEELLGGSQSSDTSVSLVL